MNDDIPPAERSSAHNALQIMRGWRWHYGNPDEWDIDRGRGLREVIHKLAMDGLPSPHKAVLPLLCSGELVARGNFRWVKYEDGERYKAEYEGELIPPRRWQLLEKIISQSEKWEFDGSEPFPEVELTELEFPPCPAFEWRATLGRFNTSVRSPGLMPFDKGYFEEWYSAESIEVWPRFLEAPDTPPEALADAIIAGNSPGTVADDVSPAREMGGRPVAADWERAALEIAGQFYAGDLKPQSIADVSRALTDWLAAQDVHPAQSTIRIHAKLIFEAIKSWDAD